MTQVGKHKSTKNFETKAIKLGQQLDRKHNFRNSWGWLSVIFHSKCYFMDHKSLVFSLLTKARSCILLKYNDYCRKNKCSDSKGYPRPFKSREEIDHLLLAFTTKGSYFHSFGILRQPLRGNTSIRGTFRVKSLLQCGQNGKGRSIPGLY